MDKPNRQIDPTPHVYGENPFKRYGSYGPSGTLAFGKVPDTYSYGYEVTYEESEIPSDNKFYGNALFGGQYRTYYRRDYTYWRVKYGRYGNEVNRVPIKQECLIDFDAWGALSGVRQKTRFEKPSGFGKFATGWADFGENSSISIGASVGRTEDENHASSFFVVHPKDTDPLDVVTEMNDRDAQIEAAKKASLAINNAMRDLANANELNSKLQSIPADDRFSKEPPYVLTPNEDDALSVNQLLFASTSEILTYDPNLMENISEVYKQIADDGISQVSVISAANQAYISIGDVVTAEYIMEFANDAYNIPPGTYRLEDIDIVEIRNRDELNNVYDDPEKLITTMPALDAMMYFSRVTEH